LSIQESGQYKFYITSDDGRRLYIDDALVFQSWVDGGASSSGTVALSAGQHVIQIDYYEDSGAASIKLEWEKLDGNTFAKEVVPGSKFTTPFGLNTDWFYTSGETPTLGTPQASNTEAWVWFEGGDGESELPLPSRTDNFGVRMTGYIQIPYEGIYRFYLNNHDNGVRFYFDDMNTPKYDRWAAVVDSGNWTSGTLSPGFYNIKIELFETTGAYRCKLEWQLTNGANAFSIQTVPTRYLYTTDPSVLDDPHFIGFQRQEYEIHGISGHIYNIISFYNLQLNAKFLHYDTEFLSEYSTWFSEVGLQYEKLVYIYVTANGRMLCNNKTIPVNETLTIGPVTLQRIGDHILYIKSPEFTFEFHVDTVGHEQWCSQGCPHIDIKASMQNGVSHTWLSASVLGLKEHSHVEDEATTSSGINILGKVHGLLGQSIHGVVYEKNDINLAYIEDEVEDYCIKSGDIFGTDFKFNQFNE